MTVFVAVIMGLVQGLTEFLPVSSSAHLVFADHFLHLRLSEADTVSFDVLLHLGTLVAVLIYFRKDIWALLRGAGQLIVRPRRAWRENADSRLFVWLIVGTLPAAVAGVTLRDFFSQAFQNVPGTAMLLLVTAAMLFWIQHRQHGARALDGATAKDALLIGLFQAAAILPGISRSGATITGGLLLGMSRDAAPRFSFLLSVPIILAGGLFDLKDTLETGFTLPALPLVAGFLAAAVSGYLAVVLLLSIVRRGRLDRFGYYCAIAGIGMLAYWTLLVPKVNLRTVAGHTPTATHGVNAEGLLGPFAFGDRVQLQLRVDTGLVPLEAVYADLPAYEHLATTRLMFRRTGSPEPGRDVLTSQALLVGPQDIGHLRPGGEMQEIWVVLRNKLGIKNEVRLRLLVGPGSRYRQAA